MNIEHLSLFLHGPSNFNICKRDSEFLFSLFFRHHVNVFGLLIFPFWHVHYDLLFLKEKMNLQTVKQLPQRVYTANKGLHQD